MARIVIVGAGIAGLTAALTLHDAGLSCDIYEAASHVGGRMHSDAHTWGDGLVSEWCGEFIDRDNTMLHQLIKRFGLTKIDLGRQRAGRAPMLVYLLNHFYGEDDLLRDFQALAPTVEQQFQDVGFPTTYAQYTQAGFALDHQSAYDWIEQYVRGGHASPLGRFIDTGCTGLYGLDTREQSALNLVYLYESRTSLRTDSLPTPLQGSSKIVGGNQQLPLAIARELPEGSLHLGSRLVEIAREDDDSVTLTFTTASGVSRVRCEAAILTLPFSTLRHVAYHQAGFDQLKRTAIEQLGYGTISKLFLRFDRPYWYDDGPWPSPHGGFVITDLDIQTLWDAMSGHPDATRSPALLVDYTSGHRGAAYAPASAYSTTADDESIQRYAENSLRQLERIFPGVSAHYTGQAALSYPTGDPNLQGSYSCWRVGQYTQFGGYEMVAQGPIHFAGEHCSIEFQGYMEGAAREGARAAREIIDGGQSPS